MLEEVADEGVEDNEEDDDQENDGELVHVHGYWSKSIDLQLLLIINLQLLILTIRQVAIKNISLDRVVLGLAGIFVDLGQLES